MASRAGADATRSEGKPSRSGGGWAGAEVEEEEPTFPAPPAQGPEDALKSTALSARRFLCSPSSSAASSFVGRRLLGAEGGVAEGARTAARLGGGKRGAPGEAPSEARAWLTGLCVVSGARGRLCDARLLGFSISISSTGGSPIEAVKAAAISAAVASRMIGASVKGLPSGGTSAEEVV